MTPDAVQMERLKRLSLEGDRVSADERSAVNWAIGRLEYAELLERKNAHKCNDAFCKECGG